MPSRRAIDLLGLVVLTLIWGTTWAAIRVSLHGIPPLVGVALRFGAAGLMLVMGSATILHLFRGENASTITTAILFMPVTVVATMRWKLTPIARQKRV